MSNTITFSFARQPALFRRVKAYAERRNISVQLALFLALRSGLRRLEHLKKYNSSDKARARNTRYRQRREGRERARQLGEQRERQARVLAAKLRKTAPQTKKAKAA